MASRSSTRKIPASGIESAGGSNWKPNKFVECALSDEDKEHVKNNICSWGRIDETLTELIAEGYGITLSADSRSDAFCVFLNAKTTKVNVGLSLSARAPTLQAAISVLFYKHYELLREEWGVPKVKAGSADWG